VYRQAVSRAARRVALLGVATGVAVAVSVGVRAVTYYVPVPVLSHTCVVTTGGGVRCWGLNDDGQLGDGTTSTRTATVLVTGLTDRVTAVTVGGYHTCALTERGGVKCWGNNANGQLGDGTTIQQTTPMDVQGLTSGVVAVSAAFRHTCAIVSNGGVKCWGENSTGQLGNDTTTSSPAPVAVLGLGSGAVGIAAGGYHTCAIVSGGGVKCWGYNMYGQLGDGTQSPRTRPVDVVGLATGVTRVAAGGDHTCALTSAGGVKCWGNLLRDPSSSFPQPTPIDMAGLTSGVVALAAGDSHTCAVTVTGGVKCWGHNMYGELGDGTTTNRPTPVDATGLEAGVVAVAAGGYYTCALNSDGGVKCWGYNSGFLGYGAASSRAVVMVPDIPGVADFNSDGAVDLATRDVASGDLVFWLMSGTVLGNEVRVAGPGDRNWRVAAVADFDLDTNADLLMHNAATGDTQIWFMSGTAQARSLALERMALDWDVATVADFSVDGYPDIVWRNRATGANAVWYMTIDGVGATESLQPVADTNWAVVAAGDFTGDGAPDLVWRNVATGENRLWGMRRAKVAGQVPLESVAAQGWTVIGAGDFNCDGSPDLV
jgi:alpha-tubulin suppressor-like RCC1 family protein